MPKTTQTVESGAVNFADKTRTREDGELTKRERYILMLASLRKTDREIAYVFGEKPQTIQKERQAFMARWGVRNAEEMFRKATEKGYLLP